MSTMILGGGMTGLAAGLASGFAVLERLNRPGGICASYEREGYHFETGGGHWIFGGDPVVNRLLAGAGELGTYRRRSAVLFLGGLPDTRELAGQFVPYPLQDNTFALPAALRADALSEILSPRSAHSPTTMADWLRAEFGPTLCRIFFDPFHERYTAGLFRTIAPQDGYKTPIDHERVRAGTTRENSDAGYNASFVYPLNGLDGTSQWLASRCDMRYGHDVVRVDTEQRRIELADGRSMPYSRILSTAPLNQLVELSGLAQSLGDPDPHTSVLVLNLGVTLPNTTHARNGWHWLYIPDSRSGFHRIGYYSNVDTRFLPAAARNDPGRASLYIETAFRANTQLSADEREAFIARVIAELKDAGLIEEVEAVDLTWVDVAYTWRYPHSDWASRALASCRSVGVEPAGRYGRWSFQGIAASLKEGLLLGSVERAIGQAGPGA